MQFGFDVFGIDQLFLFFDRFGKFKLSVVDIFGRDDLIAFEFKLYIYAELAFHALSYKALGAVRL